MKKRSLLDEIEAFLSDTGMGDSTFGHRTVNDGKLVKRLRAGGSVLLPTAEKILEFIESERLATRNQRVA